MLEYFAKYSEIPSFKGNQKLTSKTPKKPKLKKKDQKNLFQKSLNISLLYLQKVNI